MSDQSRLKRLRMRSWRRGIKEMDLILGHWSDGHLGDLDPAALDLYEEMLNENDHDLYQWVTARIGADGDKPRGPETYAALLDIISAHAAARFGPA